MLDPEFEKEVQKKMEELEFTPSEGVWMNLQHGLRKGERRRVPMLWLFFLLGGILLGAGGASLYYFNRPSPGVAGADRSGIIRMGTTETKSAAGAPVIFEAGSTETKSATGTPINIETRSAGAKTATRTPMIVAARSAGTKSATGAPMIVEAASAGTGSIEPGSAGGSPVIGKMASIGGSGELSLHQEPVGNIDYRPGDRSNSPRVKGPMAISPVTALSKRAAKKARFAAHPSWEAGFAGGGGFSSSIVPASSGGVTLPPGPITLANALATPSFSAGHAEMRISRIRPDLSFWAGIFVQRSIMKRLSFTAGLNLHYFSTRLETMQQKGPYTTSVTPLSGSGAFYGSSPYVQPAAASSSYYGADYKFNNHYYFLQLPVSLQWQVNRSRKTPIFWEGGLSLSRLISANALYYSEKSGEYYKDGGAANPYHLMTFSSLMIGLSLRGNSIKMGPEAQYGLTSLIHSANVDNQHLFYGGIKIIVMPRKW